MNVEDPTALLSDLAERRRHKRKKTLIGMHFREGTDGRWSLIPGDEDQLAGAYRDMLSISVAHAVDQCAAGHLAKNNLPRPVDPFAPNELGSGAHDVLEHVYELPQGRRDEAAFAHFTAAVSERVWSEAKLVDQFPPSLEANRKLREEWENLVGDWALRIKLMEDPNAIDVIGTELELEGVFTSNGVKSTGKIDRLERDPQTGLLTIVDYKYGVWKGEPNPKFKDGYKEQQFLYLDLYEQLTGERASSMQILYPRHPYRRIIDFNQADYEKTLVTFKSSRDTLNQQIVAKSFPTNPGPLCAWCDIARSCPAAAVKPVSEFDPSPGQPLASMPQWKQEKRLKTIKANDSARTKPASAKLGIRILDATGLDRGIHNDKRFQHPEVTSYVPQDHPEENPELAAAEPVLLAVAPRIATGEGTGQSDLEHNPEGVIMTTAIAQAPDVQQPQLAPVRAEGSPTVEVINNQLNLMAYAARPVRDIIEFSLWVLRDNNQGLTDQTLTALSSTIARLTANVMFKTTGLRSLQSGAAGHAQYFVKSAVRTFPPPFGQAAAAWQSWADRIEAVSTIMLREMDQTYNAAHPGVVNADALALVFPETANLPY